MIILILHDTCVYLSKLDSGRWSIKSSENRDILYSDHSYWIAVDRMFNNNEPHSYDLIYENCGSMIAVARYCNYIYVQVGSRTLKYHVL